MKRRSFWKDERGQSITEFALLAPLLLLLVFGIIDLGRFLYGNLQLQMAAQETVRLGGLGKSDAEMEQFARSYIHFTDSAALQFQVSPSDAERDSGDYVTVTLQTPHHFLTPVANSLLSDATTIHVESTIRVE